MTATGIAVAQTAPPPPYLDRDGNGVDLTSGQFNLKVTEGSIGSGPGAIELDRLWAGQAGWQDNWSGGVVKTVSGSTTTYYVQFGAISDTFSQSGSTYTALKGDGATLTPTSKGFTYVASDGTIITFQSFDGTVNLPIQSYACTSAVVGSCSIPTSITKPDGTKFTMQWGSALKCTKYASGDDYCIVGVYYYRWQGVTSSAGYNLAVTYQTNNPGTASAPVPAWTTRSGATFGNSVVAASPAPQITYAYPSSTVVEVTDPAGRLWHFETAAAGNLSAVRRPAATANSTTIAYTSGYVSSVTRDGLATTYARTVSGNIATTTITDALSHQTVVTADLGLGQVTQVVDPLTHTTKYGHDAFGRLTSITFPEGNQITYAPDARGNITTTTTISKTPGTPANLVTTATYPSSCTNTVTCNKPTAIIDARLNETDYTYDPTHGGILSVTQPAPTSGTVRPQTRYTYTQVDQTGAASSTGTYVVTGISACRTTASCIGTPDETKVTLTYGSNILPTSSVAGAGDGSLAATVSAAYDAFGNLYTITDPLSHTTRYRFDADHELVGMVGPDPDGAGALKNRAKRLTYNADGQITLAELGTTLSQSDPDWANFATLQQLANAYDVNGRLAQQSLQSSGTTYSLAQYSYDAVGRTDCVAQRMNTSVFGSLPAACTLGTQGGFGPDRISRTSYDAASQVTGVATGYGSPLQRTETAYTYTNNGKVQTLADAKNNLTTYVYDGFDRLSQTQYPSPTTAGTSNVADYEQLGYDAASNVTSRRLRDGNSLAYGYDALNRVSSKTRLSTEPSVTYTYDNLGHPSNFKQGNSSLITFGFDALGREISEAQPYGTISYQYDLAGNRTRLTWGDGIYVTYDYDAVNEMTAVHENGGTVIVSLTYDDLGRRATRTYGSGAVSTYNYDAVSRLTSIALTGASNLNTTTLSNYSPAGEIGSKANTSDTYAWTLGANANRGYTTNGLNQYTAIAGSSVGYDAKGNVTSLSGLTYTYSSENLLTSINTATPTNFYYDALNRLAELDDSTAKVRFVYDSDDIVQEVFLNGTVARRYVPGPLPNETFVWYDGTGTGTKRYFDQDERGSTTRVSNQSGTSWSIDSYDEYGTPGSANSGRFEYAGYALMDTAGIYYAKARMYSPALGRFLQTDPIGYAGGPNWYNYAASDPVNLVDPLGLATTNNPPADTPPSPITVTGSQSGNAIGRGGIAPSGALSIVNGADATSYQNIVVTAIRRAKSGSDILPQNTNGDGDIVVTGHRSSSAINIPAPPVTLPYGPFTPGDKPGTFYGPKQPKGPRSLLRYVPPEGQGGPPGSKGYWKVNGPDQSFDGRYDLNGNPLTADQAHPNPLPPSASIFFRGGVVGVLVCALFCADPAW